MLGVMHPIPVRPFCCVVVNAIPSYFAGCAFVRAGIFSHSCLYPACLNRCLHFCIASCKYAHIRILCCSGLVPTICQTRSLLLQLAGFLLCCCVWCTAPSNIASIFPVPISNCIPLRPTCIYQRLSRADSPSDFDMFSLRLIFLVPCLLYMYIFIAYIISRLRWIMNELHSSHGLSSYTQACCTCAFVYLFRRLGCLYDRLYV